MTRSLWLALVPTATIGDGHESLEREASARLFAALGSEKAPNVPAAPETCNRTPRLRGNIPAVLGGEVPDSDEALTDVGIPTLDQWPTFVLSLGLPLYYYCLFSISREEKP